MVERAELLLGASIGILYDFCSSCFVCHVIGNFGYSSIHEKQNLGSPAFAPFRGPPLLGSPLPLTFGFRCELLTIQLSPLSGRPLCGGSRSAIWAGSPSRPTETSRHARQPCPLSTKSPRIQQPWGLGSRLAAACEELLRTPASQTGPLRCSC